ncbi:MAG TPA: hypothetical protein VJT31_04235 [Rugosimonospora sp.]|nr:hypothetical protein [Rugosimonospora sp.]
MSGDDRTNPGILLARDQLEQWAGRTLSDDEVARLADAVPRSPIPGAIDTIVSECRTDPDDDDPGTPPELWVCPGCGTRIDASQADCIVDHVKDCDLVDGASNPIGDAR